MRISIEQACELLKQGQPVAIPTETVYGLAAPLNNLQAIDSIFQIKGRPKNNPLIIHLSEIESINDFIETPSSEIELLMHAFWPGPLTIVHEIVPNTVPEQVRSGLPTAAFRVPKHPLAQEVIRSIGPLVMPSANLSGRPSSTLPEHVERDFGDNFPVLDGGLCVTGLESTVIMEKEGLWYILREGAIPAEALANVLGNLPLSFIQRKDEAPLSPGQLYKHYSPKAKLILEGNPAEEEAIIGFSDRNYPLTGKFFSLGSSTNPQEAAQRLYSCLRELDDASIEKAWVDMNFPKINLWKTIADRLIRAASNI